MTHAAQTMSDDTLTLIAGLHKQNQAILQELQEIKKTIASAPSQPDPDDRWVLSLTGLHAALKASGMSVGQRRLSQFRACNVFRVSSEEDLECRNAGTGRRSAWRFHVGRCKEAIARFERLPVQEKRRILGQ